MTARSPLDLTLRRRPMGAALGAVVLLVSILAASSTSGTPSVEAAPGGQAARYVAITPVRVLDTRTPGLGPLRFTDILSVDPLTADVVNAAGVDPLDIEAVAINLTITEPVAPGFLKSWPTAAPTPPFESASAVNNRLANETIANFAIVPVGANGRISIQTFESTNVVVDVQGVFARSTASQSGRFVPLGVPQRAIDTRQSSPVQGGTELVVDLADSVGIPRTASAAVINLVAADTQQPGFLTAFPGGALPLASNVNYPGGNYNIAGSAITQLDDGELQIHASGTTDVIVDVIGYMTGQDGTPDGSAFPGTAGLFVPIEPERHYDSRPDGAPFDSQPLFAGQSRTIPIAGVRSVPPTGVLGVASNLTMTETDGPGYLVAYPQNPVPQNYSTVNAVFERHSIANHAVVALGNGSLSVFSQQQSDFIIDVSGYFLDGTVEPPTSPRREDTNPAPTPDVPQAPANKPPFDETFTYLQVAEESEREFAAYERDGRRYFGWNPCAPITYAVNSLRATPEQVGALNLAIRDVERASGFDFVYVGEATGSLDINSVDPRVAGGGEAMAVFGFSDPYETPVLAGGTIGIGGLGQGIDDRSAVELADGDRFAWIVRDAFAIADVTNLPTLEAVQGTFAHEIAHMVGLDHVQSRDELMFASPTRQFTLGEGDKYGLWTIGARPCTSALFSDFIPSPEPTGFDVTGWIAD